MRRIVNNCLVPSTVVSERELKATNNKNNNFLLNMAKLSVKAGSHEMFINLIYKAKAQWLLSTTQAGCL